MACAMCGAAITDGDYYRCADCEDEVRANGPQDPDGWGGDHRPPRR